jgi:uncharacterized protein (DUF924 family)
MKSAADVLQFWFVDHGQDDWFGGGKDFDDKLREKFAATHPCVAKGEAYAWRATPQGRVAEVIVLDQFSRQLHRGSGLAFAQDPMALTLSQEAVAHGYDRDLNESERMFLYMPYMHSESRIVHEEAMRLFTILGNENTLDFEKRHFEVIKQFGRYPKRNAALGRESTKEELAYIEATKDTVF